MVNPERLHNAFSALDILARADSTAFAGARNDAAGGIWIVTLNGGPSKGVKKVEVQANNASHASIVAEEQNPGYRANAIVPKNGRNDAVGRIMPPEYAFGYSATFDGKVQHGMVIAANDADALKQIAKQGGLNPSIISKKLERNDAAGWRYRVSVDGRYTHVDFGKKEEAEQTAAALRDAGKNAKVEKWDDSGRMDASSRNDAAPLTDKYGRTVQVGKQCGVKGQYDAFQTGIVESVNGNNVTVAFKSVTPGGVGIGRELTKTTRKIVTVDQIEMD